MGELSFSCSMFRRPAHDLRPSTRQRSIPKTVRKRVITMPTSPLLAGRHYVARRRTRSAAVSVFEPLGRFALINRHNDVVRGILRLRCGKWLSAI